MLLLLIDRYVFLKKCPIKFKSNEGNDAILVNETGLYQYLISVIM